MNNPSPAFPLPTFCIPTLTDVERGGPGETLEHLLSEHDSSSPLSNLFVFPLLNEHAMRHVLDICYLDCVRLPQPSSDPPPRVYMFRRTPPVPDQRLDVYHSHIPLALWQEMNPEMTAKLARCKPPLGPADFEAIIFPPGVPHSLLVKEAV